MDLLIDTTDTNKCIVRVNNTEIIRSYDNLCGHDLLKQIDEVLVKAGIEKISLKRIKVNTGPGDFSSISAGVSVANALGSALNIPVNQNQAGIFVKPVYKK